MNNIWREVIERAADTLDDLGAPLNADELRRLTTAGQQAAGVSEELAGLFIASLGDIPDDYSKIATEQVIAAIKQNLPDYPNALTAAGAAPEGLVDFEFEVWQGGAWQAGGTAATLDDAIREASHYEMMYGQAGPEVEVKLYERREISQPGAQHGQEGRDG